MPMISIVLPAEIKKIAWPFRDSLSDCLLSAGDPSPCSYRIMNFNMELLC